MEYILGLSDAGEAGLGLAGGKAANLGRLIRNGFNVPGGFCITTAAYDGFLADSGIGEAVPRIIGSADLENPDALERASVAIRGLFTAAPMGGELAAAILAAYAGLGTGRETGESGPEGAEDIPAVAVRSSATAEDLPELSFAGQQDTFLNVIGGEALLEAVKNCWSSYWTARAVGYRHRNGISQLGGSLAIAVQLMVESEVSGVLFTANPLSGKRGEIVIDAAFGLGEALVSGMVEPDHYVVSSEGSRILSRRTGAKTLSVRPDSSGGTALVTENRAGMQALSDELIIELARIGREAERLFGPPQDVEWAVRGGRIFVLQSRPVTSLYPLPEGIPAGGETQSGSTDVFFSFGAWQGMLEPFTPLGGDFFKGFAAGIGTGLGMKMDIGSQSAFVTAGSRLFLKITPLWRNPAGRKFLEIAFRAVDPVSCEILGSLENRVEFALRGGSRGPSAALRLISKIIAVPILTMRTFLGGRRKLDSITKIVKDLTDEAEKRWRRVETLSDWVAAFRSMISDLPSRLMPYLICFVSGGQVPYRILLSLYARIPGGTDLVNELTRGLEGNVTTEMDLRLWDTAMKIAEDARARELFSTQSEETIPRTLQDLPAEAGSALEEFLDLYGMRGIAEIDLGNPRWKEDPAHVIGVIGGYLQSGRSDTSPPEMFRNGALKAAGAAAELERLVPEGPWRGARVRFVRFLIDRFRTLGGRRETPKFIIVGLMAVMRERLLAAGKTYADRGLISSPDDLFFLKLEELDDLGRNENGSTGTRLDGHDWKALVRERRTGYERERRRKAIPHILLSDGTSFYTGPAKDGGTDGNRLTGNPVSSGIAEGTVRVVFDPRKERLLPGEILVCRATDPAWTPLFLTAGGLVMETGGMMTHGSVVAREYGIPAVTGVARATVKLTTGMRIRLDGSSGVIAILEE